MGFGWFKSKDSYEDRLDEVEQRFQDKLAKLKEKKMAEAIEPYRVGVTTDGKTTLTLITGGTSITLTMNPEACEVLIRVLRSTYVKEEDETTVGSTV